MKQVSPAIGIDLHSFDETLEEGLMRERLMPPSPAIALVSNYLPAQRAAMLEPMVALREEWDRPTKRR